LKKLPICDRKQNCANSVFCRFRAIYTLQRVHYQANKTATKRFWGPFFDKIAQLLKKILTFFD